MSGSAVVAAGTPVVIRVPTKAKAATVAVEADGGTIDVSWFVSLDGGEPDAPGTNAIALEWDAGQIADGNIEARTFIGSLEGILVQGDGKVNFRFQY